MRLALPGMLPKDIKGVFFMIKTIMSVFSASLTPAYYWSSCAQTLFAVNPFSGILQNFFRIYSTLKLGSSTDSWSKTPWHMYMYLLNIHILLWYHFLHRKFANDMFSNLINDNYILFFMLFTYLFRLIKKIYFC